MIHNTAPFQTCHRGEEEGPHSNKSPSIHRIMSDKILPSHDWFFCFFSSQWQNPFPHTVIEWILVINRCNQNLKNTFPLSPTVRHKHEFCKWWIFTLPVMSAKLFLWGINTIKALSFQIIFMVVSLAHLTDKEEWLLLHETKSANFPATYWSSSTVWSSPNLIPLWKKRGSKVDQIRWCLNGRPPSTAWISAGGREMGDGRIRTGGDQSIFYPCDWSTTTGT